MTETTAPAQPDRHEAASALHDAAQALVQDVFGDAQATQVPGDDFAVLQPGEVIAVYEPRRTDKYLGAFGPEQIRMVDAIMRGGYDLYVVRSVTKGGTLNLDQIANPGSATQYLADLALISAEPQRMRVSVNRIVYRTGHTYDGIREALSASPLRPAFNATLATYTAAVEAQNAAWKAERDAIKAAQAPFEADAQAINRALNWRVARVPGLGTPRVEMNAPVPVHVLDAAVYGRYATEQIDVDTFTAATNALARYETARKG